MVYIYILKYILVGESQGSLITKLYKVKFTFVSSIHGKNKIAINRKHLLHY